MKVKENRSKINIFICFFIFIFFIYSPPIYGDVSKSTGKIYGENLTITNLVTIIQDELNNLEGNQYLYFSFPLSKTISDSDDNLKIIISKIINYLDGVTSITPSISGSYIKDSRTIKLDIYKYESKNPQYYTLLNNLVKMGNSFNTDYERIKYLLDYLYTNKYIYSSNLDIKYPHLVSSKIHLYPICLPDRVLLEKEGICTGYANLITEYCEQIGLPVIKVRGNLIDTTDKHVWNLVYLSELDNWYVVDGVLAINNRNAITTLNKYSNMKWVLWEDNEIKDIKNIKYPKNINCYIYFKDIRNHWSMDCVQKLRKQGIVTGYSGNLYYPNKNITVSEFLAISLNSLINLDTDFLDATSLDIWWEKYYIFAIDNGIIEEKYFSHIKMNEEITREDMAYILINLFDYFKKDNINKETIPIFNIPDISDASFYCRKKIFQAYNLGLLTGVDDLGNFSPKDKATRAESAVVIFRLLERVN